MWIFFVKARRRVSGEEKAEEHVMKIEDRSVAPKCTKKMSVHSLTDFLLLQAWS